MNLFTNSNVEEAMEQEDFERAEDLRQADMEGWLKGYATGIIAVLGSIALYKVGGAIIKNELEKVNQGEVEAE